MSDVTISMTVYDNRTGEEKELKFRGKSLGEAERRLDRWKKTQQHCEIRTIHYPVLTK